MMVPPLFGLAEQAFSFSDHYKQFIKVQFHQVNSDHRPEHEVDLRYRLPRTDRPRQRASTLAAASIALSLAVLLGACATDAHSARDQDCAKFAHGTLRWGYYPGYGCGPIPPAQTHFS